MWNQCTPTDIFLSLSTPMQPPASPSPRGLKKPVVFALAMASLLAGIGTFWVIKLAVNGSRPASATCSVGWPSA